MENFRDRLEFILSGRKIHPWAASLGVSKGAAENMWKGNAPGPEILNAIMLKENINLSWFLSGEGSPFMVRRCETDAEFADTIRNYDVVNNQWRLLLCTDGSRLLIFLSRPQTYQYKEKNIEYHAFEVITGPVGALIHQALLDAYDKTISAPKEVATITWSAAQLGFSELSKLIQGEVGPIQAFGDGKKVKPIISTHYVDGPDAIIRKIIINNEASSTANYSEVRTELMRAIIRLVEQTAEDESISLSIEDKAKIYTSLYRHAERRGVSSKDLDRSNILSILEVIK